MNRSQNRVELSKSGALVCGGAASVDGFCAHASYRVQTHLHADHMIDFGTSKANQRILMHHASKALLERIYNADIPYRNNIISLEYEEDYICDDGTVITLFPSHHMLGAAQVLLNFVDGWRVLVSSDFAWPLGNIPTANELVVDSTYGSPKSVRHFAQNIIDQHLRETFAETRMEAVPTALMAHSGLLQEAVSLLADLFLGPVWVTEGAYRICQVYREYGFEMPELVLVDGKKAFSPQDTMALTLPELRTTSLPQPIRKLTLSSFGRQDSSPVLLYTQGDRRIAMSNHADFHETIDYVRKVAPSVVWTDGRTGDADSLAHEIRTRTGIWAEALEPPAFRGWG